MLNHRHILTAVVLLLPLCATAQVDPDFEAYRQQAISKYKAYQDKEAADFAAFRKKANEEYAAFVEQAWKEMNSAAGITPPADPKPKTPPRHKTNEPTPKPQKLTYDKAESLPPAPKPIDMPEIELPAEEEYDAEQVDFFATKIVIRAVKHLGLAKLASVAAKEVARVWRLFSKGSYESLLSDCLAQRKRLSLCDWAYIQLCGKVAEKVYKRACNEAVMLQAYLLTQSGFRVRMAESGGKLVLLAPFDHTIYNYSYLNIDGLKYYVLNKVKKGTFRVCQAVFPRERTASIAIAQQPQLASAPTQTRIFKGGRYPNMKASLAVNRNLIDFYAQYPVSDAWDAYARTSLSEQTKKALYPSLRAQLEGKDERTQVDMLLDFVQHAFEYKTDQEQFGYERPLFGDESFYYPYNDCEDRSILFSILVRDLTGLDVVLLHYPGHLATAVHFTTDVTGDYLSYNNKRFIVCDPTYIGATVGESMPEFADSTLKIVAL